jgi:hypothetical protein
MLKALRHARLDNSYEAELRKLIAVDLLIVDDSSTLGRSDPSTLARSDPSSAAVGTALHRPPRRRARSARAAARLRRPSGRAGRAG